MVFTVVVVVLLGVTITIALAVLEEMALFVLYGVRAVRFLRTHLNQYIMYSITKV